MDLPGWVKVAIVQGMAHAQLMKGRLEAEGIRVILQYESVGQIYAVNVDGLGEVVILVPEADKDLAREILSDV